MRKREPAKKVETKKEEKREDPKPIVKQPTEVSDLDVAKKMIKISQSASDRNLEFNLSFETVKKLLSYKTCYYTNRPFSNDSDEKYGRSFDRIDSSKGYVEGNVVACTIDINQKKSNMTIEEIACLYNKLVKKPNA